MSLDIVKDSTGVIMYVVIRDSVTGVLETGFDVTALEFQYIRTGEAPSVAQSVVALAATNSVHADNKAIEMDGTNSKGQCRVDFPDAAFAAGVDSVRLSVTGTGFDIQPKEIPLVDAPATAAALAAAHSTTDGKVDAVKSALTTHDNKLAPVALDGGDATIGGMLTKMADDSGGASFDAELESLKAIGDKVHTQGAGAFEWEYEVLDVDDPFDPIGDVDVWVSTDEAGNNVTAAGRTNANGIVTFYLDEGSTVYVWSQKGGWIFENPDEEVVN